MKICITALKNNLESQLDPRFGRCNYFIITSSEKTQFEAIENKGTDISEGAGLLAAQKMADKKVKHVITGNIGPRAMQFLKTAGIEINIERDISVKEAIEKFRCGKTKKVKTPTVCGYSIVSQDSCEGLWRV